MTDNLLPGRLRLARARKGLTLRQAAEVIGVSKDTLSELERGRRHPHPSTLYKIAQGYGVSIGELLELEEPALAGKAEAPSAGLAAQEDGISLAAQSRQGPQGSMHESQASQLARFLEGQQRKTLARALREYMMRRAEGHDREVRDLQSPHFRNATAATLWTDNLYNEMRDWAGWLYVNRAELIPPLEEGAEFWRAAIDAYLIPVYAVERIRRQAEKRIAAMSDAPDELAARRMEASRAEAEEARRCLEAEREAV
jgi:transcriptional regulator with XRE-family HTH domain